MKNHILLTNYPEQEAERYIHSNPNAFLFFSDDLKVEDSRDIIDEAYIANENGKTILIAANSFNIYAQNALLKVLEEPPSGVVFIIFAKAKSLLLPTIRSRMPIINRVLKQKLPHFMIDIKTLNLEQVYEFLKQLDKNSLSANDIKIQIQSLYIDCMENGIYFNEAESEIFHNALLWASHYERASYIFSVLLLMILRKKKHKKLKIG